MPSLVKSAIKTIAILAVSTVIGLGLTFIITEEVDFGPTLPFFIWVILSLITALIIRALVNRGFRKDTGGAWGPPEESRDRVINTPQFVGRFDRDKGLLDVAARMVALDNLQYQTMWMGQPAHLTVVRFRGEILDQNGSPLEYIPVEIKGESRKWIGNIVDGDRVRVHGKVEEDGILHAKRAFNYSTNSWVGERN